MAIVNNWPGTKLSLVEAAEDDFSGLVEEMDDACADLDDAKIDATE